MAPRRSFLSESGTATWVRPAWSRPHWSGALCATLLQQPCKAKTAPGRVESRPLLRLLRSEQTSKSAAHCGTFPISFLPCRLALLPLSLRGRMFPTWAPRASTASNSARSSGDNFRTRQLPAELYRNRRTNPPLKETVPFDRVRSISSEVRWCPGFMSESFTCSLRATQPRRSPAQETCVILQRRSTVYALVLGY